MKLSLIVATAHHRVIGKNNELPWRLPQDLKYFKSVTLGKPVIMGRKTFDSIGKPLPSRTNIVITRQTDWSFPGVQVAKSIQDAVDIAQQSVATMESPATEMMVIGGAEIYRQALPLADRIYLTQIDLDVDGDAAFPELPAHQWQLVNEIPGDEDAPLKHRFLTYECV
jgi:dihydrofolate reductase